MRFKRKLLAAVMVMALTTVMAHAQISGNEVKIGAPASVVALPPTEEIPTIAQWVRREGAGFTFPADLAGQLGVTQGRDIAATEVRFDIREMGITLFFVVFGDRNDIATMHYEDAKRCIGWSVAPDGSILKTVYKAVGDASFSIAPNDRFVKYYAQEREFFVRHLPVGYVINRNVAPHR
jgi:hypothetical protein